MPEEIPFFDIEFGDLEFTFDLLKPEDDSHLATANAMFVTLGSQRDLITVDGLRHGNIYSWHKGTMRFTLHANTCDLLSAPGLNLYLHTIAPLRITISHSHLGTSCSLNMNVDFSCIENLEHLNYFLDMLEAEVKRKYVDTVIFG